MTLETGRSPNSPTAPSSCRSATPRCCRPCARRSPARASTSSRSPSTSKSACTPRARSPARSSVVKAARASRRSSPAASPTGRCARRSPTTSATRSRSSPPSSAPTCENPHDVASINGASAALTVSGIPFNGPIGAVRLAHHDGEWIAHPTFQEGDESTFEIVVAGRKLDDGDVAIMMVEAGGTEQLVGALRGGRAEGHRRDDRRRARGVEAVDRGVDRPADSSSREEYEKANGPIEPIEYLPARRLHARHLRGGASSTPRRTTAEAMAIADKTERNTRLAEIEAESARRASSAPSTRPGRSPKRRRR